MSNELSIDDRIQFIKTEINHLKESRIIEHGDQYHLGYYNGLKLALKIITYDKDKLKNHINIS